MNFKILALLASGPSSYLKNLKEDVLYRFTNDYDFIGDREPLTKFQQITAISYKGSFPEALHNIDLANQETLNVHISAILGKNGSGKSSLLELMYLLVFCLAEKKPYLRLRQSTKRRIERGENEDLLNQYKQEINDILATSKLSLFYLFDANYYVLSNSGKRLDLYKLRNGEWEPLAYQSSLFFYTICINYSLYGLNSKGSYFWLDPLFHKNDGYRTPLVLNPFRKNGVIDVNIEAHLAQTRVLTNLTDDAFQTGNLIGEKEIDHISFTVVPSKAGRIHIWDISYIWQRTIEITKVDLIDVLEDFLRRYLRHITSFDFEPCRAYLSQELQLKDKAKNLLSYRFTGEGPADFEENRQLLIKYCITKIAKICMNYTQYRELSEFHRINEDGPGLWLAADRKRLVDRLIIDDSHVTLKLKQAVNALGSSYFANSKWETARDPENIEQLNYRCSIGLKSFADMVNAAHNASKAKKKRIAQFVPTALYVPSLTLRYKKGSSEFAQLSSGEQQLLHSIHAVVYHLLNLETLTGSTSYQAVNLVLDEIELYYHPEYQRVFIQTLMDTLSKLHFKKIKAMNIIFSTHSPFILSDIPSVSVLRLDAGQPQKSDGVSVTFGGNIHEMLADVFFLDQQLIGAFARKQIEKHIALLDELRHKKDAADVSIHPNNISTSDLTAEQIADSDAYHVAAANELKTRDIYRFIETIGEPVIRFKLLEMYDEVFPAEDQRKQEAKREIQRLLRENDLTKDDI